MPTSDSQLLEGSKVRIGKQIVLPFSKAIEISLRGVKVRFWRSMITMSGIILAIAFMVSVWVNGAVLEGLRTPGVRDRQVISQIAQEADKLVYRLADGTERTVDLKRDRAIRNSVSYIIRSSEPSPSAVDAGPKGGNVPPRAGPAKPVRAGSEAAAADSGESQGGKDYWLVALSLCVAVVGIVNAMLMSVTERFREIGTMKCLGALDSFIVKLFLLESAFLGGIGTAIGVVIGLLLTAISSLISFWSVREMILPAVSWGNVLEGMAVAMVAGTLLSVLGTVYPAIVAARMEPVVAMRQEA
jgi:putative ABC transport system permease protein